MRKLFLSRADFEVTAGEIKGKGETPVACAGIQTGQHLMHTKYKVRYNKLKLE